MLIVSALFFKSTGERLINLITAFQIIAYFPIYKVDFPAELEMYLEVVRKVAEFDIIPSDEIKEWLKKEEVFGVVGGKSKE